MAIQASSARASHAQPVIAVTPIRALPPSSPSSTRAVSRSKRHGAPSCASSRCVDSMVNPPRRGAGAPLASTPKVTLASPWPLVRPGTIHWASERIVQVHSPAAVIAMLPEPPVGGKELGDVTAAIAHFVVLGAVTVDVVDEPQPPWNTTAITPRTIVSRRTRAPSANALPARLVSPRSKLVGYNTPKVFAKPGVDYVATMHPCTGFPRFIGA